MRVVSWNIQWGRGADGVLDFDRTISALRVIPDVDVMCLQEVAQFFPGLEGHPASDECDEVEWLANAFPDFELIYAAGLDLPGKLRADNGQNVMRRACFGNVVLSRLKIGQVFRHTLPAPVDPERAGMQRVCIESVIQAPWGGVRVLNTHLEYASAAQRMAQVRALCTLQSEALTHALHGYHGQRVNTPFINHVRPVEAILCGDLNFEPHSAEYCLLQGAENETGSNRLWCDAWPVGHGGQVHAPTVGLHDAQWPGRQYCCDFMFVTPGLVKRVKRVNVWAETDASDHQPVILDLDDSVVD